jgi:hypothetical protein
VLYVILPINQIYSGIRMGISNVPLGTLTTNWEIMLEEEARA